MRTPEAAAILDVTDEQVARLCKARKLVAKKVPRRKHSRDTRWEVDGRSVRTRKALLASARRRGR